MTKELSNYGTNDELRWYRDTPVVLMLDEACFCLLFILSHLHSPAPTNRGGVRQVQVLRVARGATKQSPVVMGFAALGLNV